MSEEPQSKRRRGRSTVQITLTDDERETLERWARRRTSSQALALRCRIVLACAEGLSNVAAGEQLGVHATTVAKWRTRFAASRLEGLADEPRPGVPRTITDEQVEEVIVKTLEETPSDATHWSTRSLARATGMSQTAISRIWRAFGLKPHLAETWKLSSLTRSSSTRSATSSGCTSTRPRRRWCCAWTRSPRSRRWTGPRRCCR